MRYGFNEKSVIWDGQVTIICSSKIMYYFVLDFPLLKTFVLDCVRIYI